VNKAYFKFKIVILAAYLAGSIAILAWVIMGWPREEFNDLGAEIHVVPGAMGGKSLVLVSNRSRAAWTDLQVVLNDLYFYSAPTLPAGETLRLAPDDFGYIYAVPRRNNSRMWSQVQPKAQPEVLGHGHVEAKHIAIRCDQGEAAQKFNP